MAVLFAITVMRTTQLTSLDIYYVKMPDNLWQLKSTVVIPPNYLFSSCLLSHDSCCEILATDLKLLGVLNINIICIVHLHHS